LVIFEQSDKLQDWLALQQQGNQNFPAGKGTWR
jgi:hypothetical protein